MIRWVRRDGGKGSTRWGEDGEAIGEGQEAIGGGRGELAEGVTG